ncbi:MAG: hypothetical protein JO291_13010 [Acidimicrobiia bacterium]|nr:hypothetical protein [Acidimicrobiia bacterium]
MRWVVAAAVVLAGVVVAGVVAVGARNGADPSESRSARRHAPPVTVTDVDAIKPLLRHAELTRDVQLDGGALMLRRFGRSTRMSEEDAVDRFRAGTMPTTVIGDVVVFKASASVRVGEGPTFRDRPAWVVMWGDVGTFNCPLETGPPAHGRASLPVLVLAADGSQGVEYESRGLQPCGRSPIGPTAHTATFTVSVPWTLRLTAAGPVAEYTVPRCAPATPNTQSFSDGDRVTLTIFTEVSMLHRSCGTPGTVKRTEPAPRPIEKLHHGPTGPTVGRTTRGGASFRWFDGASRSEP